ncbi:MAG: response regulator [Chloroflexota bacterium]
MQAASRRNTVLNPFQTNKDAGPLLTVLVLSDEPETRLRVAERLRAAVCEVVTAETVESALAWLDEHDLPQLLICDFKDPEKDGVDFLDRARLRHGRTGLPPTIFLLDTPEDEQVAARYNASDVLTKPVSTASLFECVNKLMKDSGVTLAIPKEFDDSEPVATSRIAKLPLIGRLAPNVKSTGN